MGLWLYLLSYATGLASAPYLSNAHGLPGLALLCGLGSLVLFKSRVNIPLLLIFFWALGATLYHLDTAPPTDRTHIRAFVGPNPVRIRGTVTSVTPHYGGGGSIDLKTERVLLPESQRLVHGQLRLYVEQGIPALEAGQQIAFRSRLRAPRLYGTPGEFDLPRHLAYQDIFVTAFAADSNELAIFATPPHQPAGLFVKVRASIGRAIDRSIPAPNGALVRALVIGDKSGLSPAQKKLLAQGGVSHLFAISGLHLGLIAMLLYTLVEKGYRQSERLLLLAPPRRLLPILLLPVLLAYLLLTGNAISTRRALAMALTTGILLTGSRQTPPLKLWASCALLFLLIEPLIFYQAAFQLSFAGLFGILAWMPRWRQCLSQTDGRWRYLLILALTTTAASLSTFPLVLMNFHLFAPAGLLTNIFAIPVIGLLAVPMGLAGALTLPLWQTGAELLFRGCASVIACALGAVDTIVRLPFLGGQTLYVTSAVLLASFLLSAAVLAPEKMRHRNKCRGLLLLIALWLCLTPATPPAKLAVTALSVGQGDSTLLSFSGGRHFLIDGGGLLSKNFDVGERLLAPALGYLGACSLEAVILTHDHPDHRKGLLYLLEQFQVNAFWSAIPTENLDPDLLEILEKRHIPIACVPSGWSQPTTIAGAGLWLFAPEQKDPNLNNRSLVVLAATGNDSALLTGDLEEAGLSQLLSTGLPLPVNLLKVPHHGSRNSTPEKLLDRLTPDLAFISLGYGNSHGFPHSQVVEALQQHQIPWWSTDRHGTLQFLSDGHNWQATHWNQRLFR